jgi:hypothetical protein
MSAIPKPSIPGPSHGSGQSPRTGRYIKAESAAPRATARTGPTMNNATASIATTAIRRPRGGFTELQVACSRRWRPADQEVASGRADRRASGRGRRRTIENGTSQLVSLVSTAPRAFHSQTNSVEEPCRSCKSVTPLAVVSRSVAPRSLQRLRTDRLLPSRAVGRAVIPAHPVPDEAGDNSGNDGRAGHPGRGRTSAPVDRSTGWTVEHRVASHPFNGRAERSRAQSRSGDAPSGPPPRRRSPGSDAGCHPIRKS